MHTLCSSTSSIPPISENRRRLMQYTHKDRCNNQTLPHPTTPLGTLTHKTPLQHTLAGNSWTTSDLRVMSIVLGLLDKPSYYDISPPFHPMSDCYFFRELEVNSGKSTWYWWTHSYAFCEFEICIIENNFDLKSLWWGPRFDVLS